MIPRLVVAGTHSGVGKTTVATGLAAAFAAGRVLGVYLHGLFEQPSFVEALVGAAPERALDDDLDRLADAVEPHLDVDRLLELVG